MKVILLKDIPKVGRRYEVKDFSDGYANNALIAKGLALKATPKELEKIQKMQESASKRESEENKLFADLINKLSEVKVVLKAKSNEKGHLFSAIQKKYIVESIKDSVGVTIDEDSINLSTPIKEIGTHQIKIKKGDKQGQFNLIVEN